MGVVLHVPDIWHNVYITRIYSRRTCCWRCCEHISEHHILWVLYCMSLIYDTMYTHTYMFWAGKSKEVLPAYFKAPSFTGVVVLNFNNIWYRCNTYTRIYSRWANWRCCQHISKRWVSRVFYYYILITYNTDAIHLHAYILGGHIGGGVVSIIPSAAFHGCCITCHWHDMIYIHTHIF